MYVIALTFFAGWFGAYWWPGMERGAPNPKDPQPWMSLVIGALAGVAAVVVLRLAAPQVDVAAAAEVNGLVDFFLAVAIGRVTAGILAPIVGRVGGA